MRTFSIEMPQVNECRVSSCAYNLEKTCHARAITVGDGVNAMCDTFFDSDSHNNRRDIAGVGACKVSGCSYNDDFECQANDIIIGMSSDGARCLTFSN